MLAIAAAYRRSAVTRAAVSSATAAVTCRDREGQCSSSHLHRRGRQSLPSLARAERLSRSCPLPMSSPCCRPLFDDDPLAAARCEIQAGEIFREGQLAILSGCPSSSPRAEAVSSSLIGSRSRSLTSRRNREISSWSSAIRSSALRVRSGSLASGSPPMRAEAQAAPCATGAKS